MDNSKYQQIKESAKGRNICVLSHGASLYELEHKIVDFATKDCIWASFNFYDLLESRILHKINKGFEIVLECAASRDREFERNIRIPRMINYLGRGSLVFSTWRLLKTQYDNMEESVIGSHFIEQCILADDLLGELNVPNSLALLLCCLVTLEPNKIILFGVDGYKQDGRYELSSYYCPSEQREYRRQLLGGKLEYTLHETTADFERDISTILYRYCEKLNLPMPSILNCSPGTCFSKFPVIDYQRAIEEL